MTNKTLHGVVNGKTIELAEDPGIPVGQQVELVVTLVPERKLPWGEGLRRCAGALAEEWTEEDDRILEEIYQQRKNSTRPLDLERATCWIQTPAQRTSSDRLA